MTDPWDTLKLLADPTRLRLLHLLLKEELSVAEMQDILDMGQSRISSHLALLRKGEIAIDRKDGKRTYYSFNPNIDSRQSRLVDAACQAVADHPELKQDRRNLNRVLEKRRQLAERYFNEVAGRLGKNYLPGRSWEAIGHFLLHLIPEIEIADLGAGEGVIAQLLARRARTVYCIDNSPRMVEVGAEQAAKLGFNNLVYKLGDIEKVPLKDNSVDLALLSQALHHAQHPQKAVQEAYRILKPGGKIVVIDLKQHNFEKARELYADLWLGFTENSVYQFLKKAGFRQVEVNIVAKEEKEPNFETLLAGGVK